MVAPVRRVRVTIRAHAASCCCDAATRP